MSITSLQSEIMLLAIVLSILLNSVNSALAEDGMTLIGTAIEAFGPCDDSAVFSMQRTIGGPPDLENYWEGHFSLKKWPNISEVHLSITVDNPANITLDPNIGCVFTTDGKSFHISTFDTPPNLRSISFTIRGPGNGAFPNVANIIFNCVDVCKNPKKWKPSILGRGPAIIETEDDVKIKPTCGKRLVKHKELIINGYTTQEGDWPWHAAIYHFDNLFKKQEYKCGGTLIDSDTILTAGHCVYENGHKLVPERILVQLGKFNLLLSSPNTQEFQVYKVLPHEDFDSSSLRNDIAILKLATEVTPTKYANPVCLWDAKEKDISNVVEKLGIVVGWGLTEKDELSTTLRQAVMPIVSVVTCLDSNRNFFEQFLSDTTYCAGFKNGTTVCNGDSGGGMYLEENGMYRIRGIVSLSTSRKDIPKCSTSDYVIFTDVAQYLDWMVKTMAVNKVVKVA